MVSILSFKRKCAKTVRKKKIKNKEKKKKFIDGKLMCGHLGRVHSVPVHATLNVIFIVENKRFYIHKKNI